MSVTLPCYYITLSVTISINPSVKMAVTLSVNMFVTLSVTLSVTLILYLFLCFSTNPLLKYYVTLTAVASMLTEVNAVSE